MSRKQPVPPNQLFSYCVEPHSSRGGTVEDVPARTPEESSSSFPNNEANSGDESLEAPKSSLPFDAESLSALCALFRILDEWQRKEDHQ